MPFCLSTGPGSVAIDHACMPYMPADYGGEKFPERQEAPAIVLHVGGGVAGMDGTWCWLTAPKYHPYSMHPKINRLHAPGLEVGADVRGLVLR